MEYKVYKKIREYFNVHIYIRFLVGSIGVFIGLLFVILPIFPGSLIVGIFFLISGILMVVPGNKIRHVIKLRKGIIYLFKNIHNKIILKQKIRDFSTHIKEILEDKKIKHK